MAWRNLEGVIEAEAMPEGLTAQADLIQTLRVRGEIDSAIMENVGGYMPGNAGPGAVTFARHVGNLEGILYALGIPQRKPVAPQTWQKHYGFSVTKHLSPMYKCLENGTKEKQQMRAAASRAHKREIREQMQRCCPHLSVTLNTADALAILGYAEAMQ